MALYDYRCEDGHVQEVRHGMTESPDVRCTETCKDCPRHVGVRDHECGKPMQRVIGVPTFQAVKFGAEWFSRLPPIKVNGKPTRVNH